MKACGQCKQENRDDANYCHQCGAALAPPPATEQTAAVNPAPSPMPNDETLWRQFIGPNADHYLTTFKKFSTADGQPKFALSWNWPAFLYVSFLWFLYRKMYLHAFVYAVGPMVSTYLTGDLTAGLVWSMMAGATANYLYYWHCREHILEIKKSGWNNQPAQETVLKESGGVQPYVIWVGIVLYILFTAAMVKTIQEGGLDPDKMPPNRPATPASLTRA
jgi:Protein of unknown function (DUF2628)